MFAVWETGSLRTRPLSKSTISMCTRFSVNLRISDVVVNTTTVCPLLNSCVGNP